MRRVGTGDGTTEIHHLNPAKHVGKSGWRHKVEAPKRWLCWQGHALTPLIKKKDPRKAASAPTMAFAILETVVKKNNLKKKINNQERYAEGIVVLFRAKKKKKNYLRGNMVVMCRFDTLMPIIPRGIDVCLFVFFGHNHGGFRMVRAQKKKKKKKKKKSAIRFKPYERRGMEKLKGKTNNSLHREERLLVYSKPMPQRERLGGAK